MSRPRWRHSPPKVPGLTQVYDQQSHNPKSTRYPKPAYREEPAITIPETGASDRCRDKFQSSFPMLLRNSLPPLVPAQIDPPADASSVTWPSPGRRRSDQFAFCANAQRLVVKRKPAQVDNAGKARNPGMWASSLVTNAKSGPGCARGIPICQIVIMQKIPTGKKHG